MTGKKRPARKQTYIEMDAGLWDRIAVVAADEDRSVSATVRHAVRQYVERWENREAS